MLAHIPNRAPVIHRPSIEAIAEGIAQRRGIFLDNLKPEDALTPAQFEQLCIRKLAVKAGYYNESLV